MSSMDPEDDGTEDGTTDAGRAKERTPWEIQEIVAVALLGAIAVVAVTGVASGIISNTVHVGHLFSEPAGQALIESTQWAGLLTAFVLLCALALVWWQVDGWTDALDDLADDGSRSSGEGDAVADIDEARRHVRRNRSLTTWAGVLLVITAVAAVALVVGVVIQQTPVVPSALDWNEIVSFGGQSLATTILAGAGLYAVRRVRTQCDETVKPRHTAPTGQE